MKDIKSTTQTDRFLRIHNPKQHVKSKAKYPIKVEEFSKTVSKGGRFFAREEPKQLKRKASKVKSPTGLMSGISKRKLSDVFGRRQPVTSELEFTPHSQADDTVINNSFSNSRKKSQSRLNPLHKELAQVDSRKSFTKFKTKLPPGDSVKGCSNLGVSVEKSAKKRSIKKDTLIDGKEVKTTGLSAGIENQIMNLKRQLKNLKKIQKMEIREEEEAVNKSISEERMKRSSKNKPAKVKEQRLLMQTKQSFGDVHVHTQGGRKEVKAVPKEVRDTKQGHLRHQKHAQVLKSCAVSRDESEVKKIEPTAVKRHQRILNARPSKDQQPTQKIAEVLHQERSRHALLERSVSKAKMTKVKSVEWRPNEFDFDEQSTEDQHYRLVKPERLITGQHMDKSQAMKIDVAAQKLRNSTSKSKLGKTKIKPEKPPQLLKSNAKNSLKDLFEEYNRLKLRDSTEEPEIDLARLSKMKTKLESVQRLVDKKLKRAKIGTQKHFSRQEKAAIVIQKYARGYLLRKFLHNYILATNPTFESLDPPENERLRTKSSIESDVEAFKEEMKHQAAEGKISGLTAKDQQQKPNLVKWATMKADKKTTEPDIDFLQRKCSGQIEETLRVATGFSDEQINQVPMKPPTQVFLSNNLINTKKLKAKQAENKHVANAELEEIEVTPKISKQSPIKVTNAVPQLFPNKFQQPQTSNKISKVDSFDSNASIDGTTPPVIPIQKLLTKECKNWESLNEALRELSQIANSKKQTDQKFDKVVQHINSMATENIKALKKVLLNPEKMTNLEPNNFVNSGISAIHAERSAERSIISGTLLRPNYNSKKIPCSPRTLSAQSRAVSERPLDKSNKDNSKTNKALGFEVWPENQAQKREQLLLSTIAISNSMLLEKGSVKDDKFFYTDREMASGDKQPTEEQEIASKTSVDLQRLTRGSLVKEQSLKKSGLLDLSRDIINRKESSSSDIKRRSPLASSSQVEPLIFPRTEETDKSIIRHQKKHVLVQEELKKPQTSQRSSLLIELKKTENLSICSEFVFNSLLDNLIEEPIWHDCFSLILAHARDGQQSEDNIYGIRTNISAVNEYCNLLLRNIEENQMQIILKKIRKIATAESQHAQLLRLLSKSDKESTALTAVEPSDALSSWQLKTDTRLILTEAQYLSLEEQILENYENMNIVEELFEMQRIYHRCVFDCFNEKLTDIVYLAINDGVFEYGNLKKDAEATVFLKELLLKARNSLLENTLLLCGLIRDKEDSMMGRSVKNFDFDSIRIIREERLGRMLAMDLVREESWPTAADSEKKGSEHSKIMFEVCRLVEEAIWKDTFDLFFE